MQSVTKQKWYINFNNPEYLKFLVSTFLLILYNVELASSMLCVFSVIH